MAEPIAVYRVKNEPRVGEVFRYEEIPDRFFRAERRDSPSCDGCAFFDADLKTFCRRTSCDHIPGRERVVFVEVYKSEKNERD